MARYKYTSYISLDLGNVPVIYSLPLSSQLTLSHAQLPDAGPRTLQSPFLFCQVSPCSDLPLGALETSKLEEEEETSSILPPSGILLAPSGSCEPHPAMLHHLAATDPFPGGIWIQFAILSNTWKSSFTRLCLPQIPASHCFSLRGLDPTQTPPLSSDTSAPATLPSSLKVWEIWVRASQGLVPKFLFSIVPSTLVVVAASWSCYLHDALGFNPFVLF